MLNLRAGNVAGLTRAGPISAKTARHDIPGSIDLMQLDYDATPYQEAEDRAWLLTQNAHLHYLSGEMDQAERFATGALGLFPGYHYALGTLAQVRTAQHRDEEAVELLRQRYNAAQHAENLYPLAEALSRAGHAAEASAAYAEFEKKALLESNRGDNANHELIAYYVDVAQEPAKALKLAQEELVRRHDVFTVDGYAWALAANGDYTHAKEQIQMALAVGVKDPRVLNHASGDCG